MLSMIMAAGCGGTTGAGPDTPAIPDEGLADAADVADVADAADVAAVDTPDAAHAADVADVADAADAVDTPDAAHAVDTASPSDLVDEAQDDPGTALDASRPDSAADVPPPPTPWRAMSFNLRTPFGDVDQNAWEFRQELVLDVLARHAPDLLGTQEGWGFQLDAITQAFPGYAWAGASRTDSDLDEYCAVFWRTDRFEAEASGTFWLGTDPSDPTSRFGPAQAFPRIATWVRLHPRDGSGSFLFMNTHVDYETRDFIQEQSAALLARKAAELGGELPVILTGDFNAPPDSPAFQILTGAMAWEEVRGDFTDAWTTDLGLPEAGTFHGFTGVAPGARIDWILHRGGLKARAIERVLDASADGRYPSDHFPVWADLERR